jgi:regulator of sigma E protease
MTIIATIVVLGVLIFVHELGHFWAAKAVGIEVERFPSVWARASGASSEGGDGVRPERHSPGRLREDGGNGRRGDGGHRGRGGGGGREAGGEFTRDFDSKPIWARTLVISAGVIMNMLFALFAFTFVAGIWGSPAADTNRLGGVRAEWLPSGAEALAEIPAGAEIQRVAGQEIRHWGDLREQLTTAPAGTATVEFLEPAGSVEFTIPADAGARLDIGRALSPWNEPVVGSVEPGGPADGGGLRAGDRLLDVGGTPIVDWSDVVRAIEARPDTRTEILVERDGRELTRVVTPRTVEGRDPVTGAARTIGQIGMVPTGGNIVYTRVASRKRSPWAGTRRCTSPE